MRRTAVSKSHEETPPKRFSTRSNKGIKRPGFSPSTNDREQKEKTDRRKRERNDDEFVGFSDRKKSKPSASSSTKQLSKTNDESRKIFQKLKKVQKTQSFVSPLKQINNNTNALQFQNGQSRSLLSRKMIGMLLSHLNFLFKLKFS
jgi:hypothetical protein